jgi:hypothetical protein
LQTLNKETLSLKNRLPKNIIVPAIFGMLLYIFLFLSQNWEVFSNNTTISWIAMLLGAVVLYGIVIGAINNLTNLDLGFAGYKLSSLLFGLVIPLGLFLYNNYHKTPKPSYSSLLEKENITLKSNNKECVRIKYGSFTNGTDTIVSRDYELIKSSAKEIKNRIKWLDSCSYVRLENINSVSDYIRLGNFEDNQHYRYTKPGVPNYTDQETYEMIITIKRTD